LRNALPHLTVLRFSKIKRLRNEFLLRCNGILTQRICLPLQQPNRALGLLTVFLTTGAANSTIVVSHRPDMMLLQQSKQLMQ
jgi:hypothetical protein